MRNTVSYEDFKVEDKHFQSALNNKVSSKALTARELCTVAST